MGVQYNYMDICPFLIEKTRYIERDQNVSILHSRLELMYMVDTKGRS